MIHFNLRKGILTCGYFILFIASGIHVSAACTNTNNNLNEVAQPFLTGTSPYESHTQGMCIAETISYGLELRILILAKQHMSFLI